VNVWAPNPIPPWIEDVHYLHLRRWRVKRASSPELPRSTFEVTLEFMDDSALFERLRQGDQGAFDALFREWYAPLVRVADALLHDRGAAEEVVQDVMLELWRRREQIVLHQPPRAYLVQATRNRALNHLRRLKVEKRGEPRAAEQLTPPVHADSRVTEAELDRAITLAIAELPTRCREVFELSRVRGLKYAEIADVMGISVKTVEVQMGKALRILRERLSPWLPKGGSPTHRATS
jgi:RNA polymerase sigma-19 factor, ECF subfamily